jgi:outer membrane protein TolC
MNILTKQSLFMALLAAGIFCGCRSYEPKPIDWNEEANAGVTNEVRIASLDDAVTLALIGNRELNALRLKSANSAKAAKESGWWEDPELDFDLMRIINPSEHPFLGGASIAFTIPLSGATAIAAKADELYAQADIAEIKAAERDTGAEARHAAIRLAALRRRAALLSEHDSDERIVRARENVGKLHEAGEVSASELAGVQRQKHIRHHALMETEREIAETEIAFLRILGLRPGTKISLTLPLRDRPSMPSGADDPLELVQHPKVEAALARLGGTEKSLEAEIRRQYPDLKLGPAYANEEGLDRFGLIAGASIPLWNRNRKAIAEASATREILRLEAIDVWRGLVCEAASAYATLVHLAGHPPVPSTEIDEADKLADAGELTPLDYLTVREEILDQKLSEAHWLRDIALAAVEFEKFK